MVIKARNYLNKSGLITIYYSFIYPYLTYCNHIWGCTYKTNLQRLVTLQNRIVRIISHAKARNSSHPLYTQLGIMKFSDLNKYLIARFMFRYAKASVPDSFGSLFQRNNEYHNHETRSAAHFHIPVVTSDLGKTGIRFRGAFDYTVEFHTILKIAWFSPESSIVFCSLLRWLSHRFAQKILKNYLIFNEMFYIILQNKCILYIVQSTDIAWNIEEEQLGSVRL